MTITGAQIIERVRELAAAEPEFVYHAPPNNEGNCSYVTGAEGRGCIVGQALQSLGLDLSESDRVMPAGEFLEYLNIPATDAELWWLEDAQARQDDLSPWGLAVAGADGAATA